MSTLLDTVRGLVTPQLVSRLASSSGESNTNVTTALTSAVPLLLGNMANQSDDRGFVSQLMSLVTDPGAENAAAGLSTSAAASESSLTTKLLSLVSGGSPSHLADSLGRTAGVKSSTATALLPVAGSLVLSALAKIVRTDRLDAGALVSRLRGEAGAFSGVSSAAPVTAYKAVPTEVIPETRRKSSAWRWAIPVVLGALALWALTGLLGRRGDDSTLRTAAGTPGAVATTGEMLSHTLPTGQSLRYPRGAAEDRLLKELQGGATDANRAWIDFDRIGFATGSTSLTQESQAQIRNIAAILQAFPDTRVKVGGYTDDAGDPAANLQLSRERATAVRDALNAAGVDAARLEAEGYGEQHPVASNDTDAGRQRNRRVALRVETR